jgi:hypothetical protein
MQGIFLNFDRPKSKKAIRKAATGLGQPAIHIEATSLHGNEYDGPLRDAPDGKYHFVGPCPYTKRNFYGTIEKAGNKVTVK